MSISRRKYINVASAFAVGFTAVFKTGSVKPDTGRKVLGYDSHDEVSVSLLKIYARSMALEDEDARWQAQMMLHDSQLARDGGGTMSHKLGYKHRAFLKQQEGKVLTDSDLFALTLTK